MPNSAAAGTAPALPEDTDEVVALGARLGEALRQHDNLQSRAIFASRAQDGSVAIYLDKAYEHQDDEIDALRDMIASVQAASLTGAAVQIVEALNRLELIWNRVEEEDSGAGRDKRAAERLLYSALEAVDAAAGRKLMDLAGPGFASPRCNPWLPVEDRCPALRTGSAQA